MSKRFTGWHMATILVAFFGTVAAVNFTMARYAAAEFAGVVVENSYVASQEFNGWLEAAEAQEALGWQVTSQWREDGHIELTAEGPSAAARITASARHPLGRLPDRQIAFDREGQGRFVSRVALPQGRWILRYEIADGADLWRREERLP